MTTINNKQFVRLISKADIIARTAEISKQLDSDFFEKEPIFIGVLNGCFMFLSELFKTLTIPCTVSFVKVQSYEDMTSKGKITEVIGLNEDISGRHVIIVEDIIDTGLTMQSILGQLSNRKPASLSILTLLHKKEVTKVPLNVDYVGFEIEDKFVLGFGLDYNGLGRNCEDILVLKD